MALHCFWTKHRRKLHYILSRYIGMHEHNEDAGKLWTWNVYISKHNMFCQFQRNMTVVTCPLTSSGSEQSKHGTTHVATVAVCQINLSDVLPVCHMNNVTASNATYCFCTNNCNKYLLNLKTETELKINYIHVFTAI